MALAVFKENPGGEYRKSYHGYPHGYATLLHSPEHFICEPMQIDTHNREYKATDQVGYKPSFLPKAIDGRDGARTALQPQPPHPHSSTGWPDDRAACQSEVLLRRAGTVSGENLKSSLSPLIECPCSDRITRCVQTLPLPCVSTGFVG